jgi:hypothetical protein
VAIAAGLAIRVAKWFGGHGRGLLCKDNDGSGAALAAVRKDTPAARIAASMNRIRATV